MALPALDPTVAGMKTSAAGFSVALVPGLLVLMAIFFSRGSRATGAGCANPNAGFNRSTEIVCSLSPTLMTKNLSSLATTRKGPSYGRVRGGRLAPCLMKTCSALLRAGGNSVLDTPVCQAGSGHLAVDMSAFSWAVKSCKGCRDSGSSGGSKGWPGRTNFAP